MGEDPGLVNLDCQFGTKIHNENTLGCDHKGASRKINHLRREDSDNPIIPRCSISSLILETFYTLWSQVEPKWETHSLFSALWLYMLCSQLLQTHAFMTSYHSEPYIQSVAQNKYLLPQDVLASSSFSAPTRKLTSTPHLICEEWEAKTELIWASFLAMTFCSWLGPIPFSHICRTAVFFFWTWFSFRLNKHHSPYSFLNVIL